VILGLARKPGIIVAFKCLNRANHWTRSDACIPTG
jgi:hypothetical protein